MAAGAARDPRDHFRQAMIGLRPHHHIHHRRAGEISSPSAWATQPATATSMRPPLLALSSFHSADAAQFGIDFLRRLFADVAGVEDHHVGVLGRLGPGIPKGASRSAMRAES